MERWFGKVAFVTGASSGIGAEIAKQLVKVGIKVVAAARRLDRLQELKMALSGESGELHPMKMDVTKEEEILQAFKWTEQNLGGVDILINNAGIVRQSSLIDGKTEDWKLLFDTNVIGLCIATREALQSMKSRNVDGHIIQINSVVGHTIPTFAGAHLNVYPASKHAVTALQECLRQELNTKEKGRKIKVTSLSPGLVSTDIGTNNAMSGLEHLIENIEQLEPIDVANAAMYILSTPRNVLVSELTIRPLDEP